jgi:acyl-CoA synthetase (AMP-forming)/AMP-acid ligase II
VLTGSMLACSARRFPQKTAIIDAQRTLSYAAFDAAATRFANYLIERLGVRKGEKVAIMSRNRLEYGIAFFGAARSGAVLVNISTMYGSSDLAYVLTKSDARVLVYDTHFAELVESVKPKLPSLAAYLPLPDPQSEPNAFLDLLEPIGTHTPAVTLSEDDAFCINYTGGTTGLPKGALVSHRARSITAHTAVIEEGLDERDVVCIVTPMFHIAGLKLMFQASIMVGATVVFARKWSVADFADLCERQQLTAVFLVPTQVVGILNEVGLDLGRLASWRKLVVGGAPVANETLTALSQRLPQVAITQIYGQTEIGIVTSVRPWHLPAKLGSCGRPAYNVEVAVVDPQGSPVPVGEIGEVVARGDNVMLGYYNDPEQTANFFRRGDGWGWTGDLARVDADGFITLVDRANDMIISGGVNIYPKEIENVLYRHPAVAECAVFGIPDPKWGEVPAAFIRLAAGHSATAAEIDQFCREQTSGFKRPKLIEFVADFPRTPVGKIQKNVLRQRFR